MGHAFGVFEPFKSTWTPGSKPRQSRHLRLQSFRSVHAGLLTAQVRLYPAKAQLFFVVAKVSARSSYYSQNSGAPRYQLKPKTAQDRGFVASLNTEAAEEVPALDSTRGFRVVCGSCRDYSRVHKGSLGSHWSYLGLWGFEFELVWVIGI